jgi:8-oxo-dGTP diphosphatase
MNGYCSRCAAPMATAILGGKERNQCPDCGFVVWRNPAPVGLALIEHEGKLVLIRRNEDPLATYWAPPAGYVECGESVPEAVKREAHEECGLDIVLDGLVDVCSQADVEVLIVVYRAHSIGGILKAGDDASEVGLFRPQDLPVQAYPATGTVTDQWFYRVIEDTIARWRDRVQDNSTVRRTEK